MPDTAPRRRIVAVDEDAVETVLEGLRMEADRRKRVATRLAGEVIDTPTGKADQRPDALRIARFLATAARLEVVADALEAAEPVAGAQALTVDVTADTEALTAAARAAAIDLRRLDPAVREAQDAAPTTPPADDEDDDPAEALAAMGMTEETPTP